MVRRDRACIGTTKRPDAMLHVGAEIFVVACRKASIHVRKEAELFAVAQHLAGEVVRVRDFN